MSWYSPLPYPIFGPQRISYPGYYQSIFSPYFPFPVIPSLSPELAWRAPWYAQEIGVARASPRQFFQW
ncbi:hypothetical protein [[Eubacterium] cellulosolvens]|jgi:hypothetical protein|nr:hypothetical protein [Candidatus Bathyarchaeota archaeon]